MPTSNSEHLARLRARVAGATAAMNHRENLPAADFARVGCEYASALAELETYEAELAAAAAQPETPPPTWSREEIVYLLDRGPARVAAESFDRLLTAVRESRACDFGACRRALEQLRQWLDGKSDRDVLNALETAQAAYLVSRGWKELHPPEGAVWVPPRDARGVVSRPLALAVCAAQQREGTPREEVLDRWVGDELTIPEFRRRLESVHATGMSLEVRAATVLRVLDLIEEKWQRLDAVGRDEYWAWQGDGEDYPESLTCPVVMTAEQLRALLELIRDLLNAVEEADADRSALINAARDQTQEEKLRAAAYQKLAATARGILGHK